MFVIYRQLLNELIQRPRKIVIRCAWLQNEFHEISYGRFDAQDTSSRITFHHGQARLRHFLVTLRIGAGVFAGGEFVFQFCVPSEYPIVPPRVRVLTRTFHPQLDARSGGVGCAILDRDWKSVCTINMVIFSLESMFLEPDAESQPLCTDAAHLWLHNRPLFQARAQQTIAERALVDEYDNDTGRFVVRARAGSALCDQCSTVAAPSFSAFGSVFSSSLSSLSSSLGVSSMVMAGGRGGAGSRPLLNSKRVRDAEVDSSSAKLRLLSLGGDGRKTRTLRSVHFKDEEGDDDDADDGVASEEDVVADACDDDDSEDDGIQPLGRSPPLAASAAASVATAIPRSSFASLSLSSASSSSALVAPPQYRSTSGGLTGALDALTVMRAPRSASPFGSTTVSAPTAFSSSASLLRATHTGCAPDAISAAQSASVQQLQLMRTLGAASRAPVLSASGMASSGAPTPFGMDADSAAVHWSIATHTAATGASLAAHSMDDESS